MTNRFRHPKTLGGDKAMSNNQFVMQVFDGKKKSFAMAFSGYEWACTVKRARKIVNEKHPGLYVEQIGMKHNVCLFVVHNIDERIAVYALTINDGR